MTLLLRLLLTDMLDNPMENIVIRRIQRAQNELKTAFSVEFWYIRGDITVHRIQEFVAKIEKKFQCPISIKPVDADKTQAWGFVLPPNDHHVWFNVTPLRYKNIHKSYRFEYVYNGIEDMGNAVSEFISTVQFYEKPKPTTRKQKRND